MNVSGWTDAQYLLAATAQMPVRDAKRGAQCSQVGIALGLALEKILQVGHNVLTPSRIRGVFTWARRQAPDQGMDQLLFHAVGRLRIGNRLRPHPGSADGRGMKLHEAAA